MELLSVTAVRASRFSRAPLECSRHRSPVAAGWLRAEITAGPKRDFLYDRIRPRAFALRSQLAERIPKMSSASMMCTVKELCSNRRTGPHPYPRTQPWRRALARRPKRHSSSEQSSAYCAVTSRATLAAGSRAARRSSAPLTSATAPSRRLCDQSGCFLTGAARESARARRRAIKMKIKMKGAPRSK